MKATIFHKNEHINIIISEPVITPEKCRKNLKLIHTTITSQYLSSRKNNKDTSTIISGQYRIQNYHGTVPRYFFSTGTGTVGKSTAVKVLRYFTKKYRGTPSNFRFIESFLCKHCDMFLFFVSIAASK